MRIKPNKDKGHILLLLLLLFQIDTGHSGNTFQGKRNRSAYPIALTSDFRWCRHSLSRHRISRHFGYVDIFVKSRIQSLYILYIFILYKSTFVGRHFAYIGMFLRPKQCFHALI